jgi:hypothetical protein
MASNNHGIQFMTTVSLRRSSAGSCVSLLLRLSSGGTFLYFLDGCHDTPPLRALPFALVHGPEGHSPFFDGL